VLTHLQDVRQIEFTDFAGKLLVVKVQADAVTSLYRRLLTVDPLLQALQMYVLTTSFTFARGDQGVIQRIII
jgi:hypothetical protein